MPMYEGFFDHQDKQKTNKMMLKVRARDESEAKSEFTRECPDTHELTAMALKDGHARRFLIGSSMNTIEHAKYARTQRLLPPTDEALEQMESEREMARAAEPAPSEKAANEKVPSLEDLKKRHTTPTSASLINAFGILMVAISVMIGLYLFNLEGLAIKALAMSVIPSIVGGLLLIAVAWSMKALNRIAIASEYQARLSEYQHQNPPETE